MYWKDFWVEEVENGYTLKIYGKGETVFLFKEKKDLIDGVLRLMYVDEPLEHEGGMIITNGD